MAAKSHKPKPWRIVKKGNFFIVQIRVYPLVWRTEKKILGSLGHLRNFPIYFECVAEAQGHLWM